MPPNQDDETRPMVEEDAGTEWAGSGDIKVPVPPIPNQSKFLARSSSSVSATESPRDVSSLRKSVQFHQDSMGLDDKGADTKSTKSGTSQNASMVSGSTNPRGHLTRQNSIHIKSTENFKEKMELQRKEHGTYVFLPWNRPYKLWFAWTVAWSVFTLLFETFSIAFLPGGGSPRDSAASVLEYCFMIVFVGDILVNYNLAYTDHEDQVVFSRKKIAWHYMKNMFLVDFIGVFPFTTIALAARGEMGVNNQATRYLQLLGLFRLVRLHRVKTAFAMIQYSSKISLLWLTLIRDFGAALLWSHFAACTLYFIARQESFQDSWIEPPPEDSLFDLYVTSLYWSVVTFATVGYGDYSPVSSGEQIFDIIYMFINMILSAWIIGSITLLVVKNDQKNGEYRENLQLLDEYSNIHDLDKDFRKRLKNQLKLDFNSREVSDENVLKHFPSSLRRRVLRELYLPTLRHTHLMQDLREVFVDSFLSSCTIEFHGPGEELVQRGSICNDLFLLLEGTIKFTSSTLYLPDSDFLKDRSGHGGSVVESEYTDGGGRPNWTEREGGDFINDIGFFTESPSFTTIRSVTICKTLTMSKSVYKSLAADHPGSAVSILQNLLAKAKFLAAEGLLNEVEFPKPMERLRAGSAFDLDSTFNSASDENQNVVNSQDQAIVNTVEELVTLHINKQQDDHTTRFLFAASRNDIPTMRLMINYGFDPNSADYDRRTALMVASMNGNVEGLKLLLENHCNPNLVDVHGTSALYEAVKGSHEECMQIILKNGGKLCMSDEAAATKLCQCVFDGDIKLLARLAKGGINLNAGDYDKRTALHIAVCEGNVTAVRVLVEYGADLLVRDRWNQSIFDEAKRSNSIKVMEYLKSLEGYSTIFDS